MVGTLTGRNGSEIVLSLPFTGLWLTQNSPARRVPSHGTDLMGERYAIDFVGVDARGRTANSRDWQTLVGTEPPERFVGFGRPIVAPVGGVVVGRHDGEPDHDARRSPLALVPYLLSQRARLEQGVNAIAGNHVILELEGRGAFVALVHLKNGSMRVGIGDRVTAGDHLADCGNSGNSSQPHLHLQAMDSVNLGVARGIRSCSTVFASGRRAVGLLIFRTQGCRRRARLSRRWSATKSTRWNDSRNPHF